MSLIPDSLKALRDVLSNELDQQHLFPASDRDSATQLVRLQELAAFESSYPGGIVAYLKNAKRLLAEAKAAESLEFSSVEQPPIVIHAPSLLTRSEELCELEAASGEVMRHSVFVLVAGGLGERLGFSGIKTSLPVDTASGVSFLEHFITNFVPSITGEVGEGALRCPRLVIMTSDDTHARTIAHLNDLLSPSVSGGAPSSHHNNHRVATSLGGLKVGVDIVLVKQNTVPCLADNEGRIAVDPVSGHILRKPHGHGDVHMLLHTATVKSADDSETEGGSTLLVDLWKRAGVQYVCFVQDTNATSTWTLPVSLALCNKHQLDMAFTCVPRIPKEAVGLLCHVQPAAPLDANKTPAPPRTVNVEYNKFDPIFRALYGSGDVASTDPTIAPYSPFPGSIITLIARFSPYSDILAATSGAVPEFINPKYRDANLRTDFKAPTRVESLMQDVALLFDPVKHRVGGIVFERQLYHPVKNNLQEALAKFAIGGDAHCAATGEENMYLLFRKRLRHIGVQVADVAGCCLSLPSAAVGRVSGSLIELSESSSSSYSLTSQLLVAAAGEALHPQNIDPVIVGNVPGKGDLTVQLFPMITVVGGGVHRRCSLSSLSSMFPFPDQVKISGRSTLVIYADGALCQSTREEGGGRADSAIVIDSLELDGALTIQLSSRGGSGTTTGANSGGGSAALGPCRFASLSARNRGWSVDRITSFDDEAMSTVPEVDRMRGYRITPLETLLITITVQQTGPSIAVHQAKM
jgi:UDP-sugar pyrophosphorylase